MCSEIGQRDRYALLINPSVLIRHLEKTEMGLAVLDNAGYETFVASPVPPDRPADHYVTPTIDNVLDLIKGIKGKIDADDELVIYTTGHGAMPGETAPLCFEKKCYDFSKTLDGIQYGQRVVVMDQCYGGSWGSIFLDDGNRQDAEEQLVNIWQNVRLVGSSAQSTLALFELGAGDALVTYEQQAYFARQRGIPLEVILPERTALAVQYAVVIDDNVMFYERALVDAFISFIQSENGQKILQQYYFRSATGDCDSLPRLAYPFTEEDLGGWSQVYDDLILGFWVNKIQPVLDLADFDTFLVRGE